MKQVLLAAAITFVASAAVAGGYSDPVVAADVVTDAAMVSGGGDEWVLALLVVLTIGLGITGQWSASNRLDVDYRAGAPVMPAFFARRPEMCQPSEFGPAVTGNSKASSGSTCARQFWPKKFAFLR